MRADIIALGPDALPASGKLIERAAYTADQTSDVISTLGATGLIVVINAVKVGSAPSVVFTIKGVVFDDAGNEIDWDILASVAVASTIVKVLRVSPNVPVTTNVYAQDLLPDRVKVFCDHSNTDELDYSVTAILTP